MSLGERVMSLTRNFKTVMIIIQNVTIEDVTFLPEDGKVVYFKMHPKVTTCFRAIEQNLFESM